MPCSYGTSCVRSSVAAGSPGPCFEGSTTARDPTVRQQPKALHKHNITNTKTIHIHMYICMYVYIYMYRYIICLHQRYVHIYIYIHICACACWTPNLKSVSTHYTPSQNEGSYSKPQKTRKKHISAQILSPYCESMIKAQKGCLWRS